MASSNHAERGGEVQEAMRHAAERLSSDLSRTARDAREAAEELGRALRHSAGDVADHARQSATEATHTVQQSVRKHPIAWIGGAAGVGALVGMLLSQGRR